MREAPEKPAGAVLELGDQAEAMVVPARSAQADAIAKAQAEMMSRVRAEQHAITEKRARIAAEDCIKRETVTFVDKRPNARSTLSSRLWARSWPK